ncbi:hypothetical protein GCM10008961_21430 [Deinococcus knuensis]|uniref:Uncharacterized protein n=1 Tax=Deinococcus knuensis TaxID=1837380 RepID=A0ABQ2SK89_9DEIO|nr:hypothetical protein GCM10008961_21430 [Deinococcus knuensis]
MGAQSGVGKSLILYRKAPVSLSERHLRRHEGLEIGVVTAAPETGSGERTRGRSTTLEPVIPVRLVGRKPAFLFPMQPSSMICLT